LSELVKWIGLLIILSRLPPAIAGTVIVNAEPAITVEGALMTRFATGAPQPNATNPATEALNAHTCIAARILVLARPSHWHENLVSTHFKPALALATLSSSPL